MTGLDHRSRYKPSGKVDWGRFLPLTLCAMAGTALLAEGMNLLFAAGYYILFFVPLVAVVFVMGMLWKAIRVGRCRSPL